MHKTLRKKTKIEQHEANEALYVISGAPKVKQFLHHIKHLSCYSWKNPGKIHLRGKERIVITTNGTCGHLWHRCSVTIKHVRVTTV